MNRDIARSNSLADLAARIRNAHRDVGNSLTYSVERAFDAGNLLIEAKSQLKHGEWLPWLRDHVEISERTARRYMRVASHREQIGHVADLTLNGALALLTTPSTAEKIVATAETSEAIQDNAEAARRQVIFDAFKHNAEAITAINERLVPGDFDPGPEPEWLQKFFDELLETGKRLGDEYTLAVECGDHAGGYAIASWFYDLSGDLRSMAEEVEAAVQP